MGINLVDPLYFMQVRDSPFFRPIAPQCGPGGKFLIDVGKKFVMNRFIARQGEWSLPWKQDILPGTEMPAYDSTFNKSFSQVTDERAMTIKSRIQQGEKFSLMYSGGIDSTIMVTALIKNLTVEELLQITICMNVDSILENPIFWKKYIDGKLRIINSSNIKLDGMIKLNTTPIIGDLGDAMFGTSFAISLYNNYDYLLQGVSDSTRLTLQNLKYRVSDSEVHYSVYKDLIIKHLSLPYDPMFGQLLYEKYVHNINTSTFPVHSLHDFFWWGMFSIKYVSCAGRSAINLNDSLPFDQVFNSTIDWYGTNDYQQWAMNNNNNGQKIRKTEVSYKFAAKEYIQDFTKDSWFNTFKIKLDSGTPLNMAQLKGHLPENNKPWSRIGVTHDYEIMFHDDPAVVEFLTTALVNFKIDWA